MMPELFTVPEGRDELSFYLHANATDHTIVRNAVLAQHSGAAIPSYPIRVFHDEFLEWHQRMHDAVNAVLGTNGFDLQDVDWKSPAQRQAWVWLHGSEHQSWATKLQI